MMRTSLVLCGLLAGAVSMAYGVEAPGNGGEVANGTLRAGAEPPLSPGFRWGGGGRVEKAIPYQ